MSQARRKARKVVVRGVEIGSDAPVTIQSMTKTDIFDTVSTLNQIEALHEAGCELFRIAVPSLKSAKAFREIRGKTELPLVADIHFDARIAIAAIDAGADKIRLNPGNIRDRDKVRDVLKAAKGRKVPIRIGVNSGSIVPRDGAAVKADTRSFTDLMVDETLRYCEFFEQEGFSDIVLSLKASDCKTTLDCYRRAAARCDYPLHLGVTAAGPPAQAFAKSALVIGSLLADGIGDTIRVSMTGDPVEEVTAGRRILNAALGVRDGIEIISCPTCGRTNVDIIGIIEELERRSADITTPLKVAVMGCVVNGPGEAKEADVGFAADVTDGVIFRKGERLRRVTPGAAVEELLKEIRSLS